MFKSDKFYIIIMNNGFIIINERGNSENTVDFKPLIPNIPFYHHLFDEDNEYVKDIKDLIKRMKIKDVTIILPDDSMDVEVDKRVLIEFFLQCGAKKTQIDFPCFQLNSANKKYISVSKTTRTLVIQYIVNNKSISKKYYDKDYLDMVQIITDIKYLHPDCQYDSLPTYINNINKDMDRFNELGILISLEELKANIIK